MLFVAFAVGFLIFPGSIIILWIDGAVYNADTAQLEEDFRSWIGTGICGVCECDDFTFPDGTSGNRFTFLDKPGEDSRRTVHPIAISKNEVLFARVFAESFDTFSTSLLLSDWSGENRREFLSFDGSWFPYERHDGTVELRNTSRHERYVIDLTSGCVMGYDRGSELNTSELEYAEKSDYAPLSIESGQYRSTFPDGAVISFPSGTINPEIRTLMEKWKIVPRSCRRYEDGTAVAIFARKFNWYQPGRDVHLFVSISQDGTALGCQCSFPTDHSNQTTVYRIREELPQTFFLAKG